VRLCDDCIQKISDSLSAEVAEILQKKIFPLLKKRENVSGRELAQAIDLDRTGVKQVIEELKNHLLLEYSYRGRKRIYSLTETAERYRKLEENPELVSTSAVEAEEQEAELTQEKDKQAEAEAEDQEKQKEKEANRQSEEKKEQDQGETDEERKSDIAEPEEADSRATTSEKKKEKEKKEETESQDEELVWNMKL